MVDSQVIEEVEVPSSEIPSFIQGSNANENFHSPQEEVEEESDIPIGSAEAVIPFANYIAMQNNPTPCLTQDSTQYTPLSIDFHQQNSGYHRKAEVRRMALLCLKHGMHRTEVARHFKVNEKTIRRWKNDWKIKKKIEPGKSSGRPRLLWDAPIKKILDALDKNPSATNEMLTALTHNIVSPQSISNYLKREQFSRKKIVDGGAQKMDDRIIGETRDFHQKVKDIPWEKRVYMDESFVYNNEAPSMGRSKKGAPINRIRDKRGKRLTMYLAIRVDGLVHPPILKPLNADDKEFMKYVEESLVPCLRPGEVVIWDRLGRSGRAKNPCKQHYNPLARGLIEAAGCQLMILPPKGKYFDPIELVFGLLKGEVRRTYGQSIAAMEQRPRTEAEIREAVQDASRKISLKQLRGFYKERANGRSFKQVFPELVEKVFF